MDFKLLSNTLKRAFKRIKTVFKRTYIILSGVQSCTLKYDA